MAEHNLNIGYLSPGWPLSSFPNGIVAYVENLVAGFDEQTVATILAQQGHNQASIKNLIILSGIAVNRGYKDKVTDALIYKINNSFTNKLRLQRWCELNSKKILAALDILEQKIDLLEVEESFGIAHWLSENQTPPVVTRLHGPWFIHGPILKVDQEVSFKYRVDYEGLGIKESAGITAPSKDVLDRVRDYYDLALPNAVVIPNPVQEISENHQWQGLTSDREIILFVGRFDLHKGGDLVIEAFRIIAQTNPDVELYFVGPDRGITINGQKIFFEAYKNKVIPESGIRQRIKYFGHISTDQISQLRQQSLITIVASRYETFCISLVEALATGCPVVAASCGAIVEIIKDGYNGLLAEASSAESIAEKATALIDDRNLMKLLSENALIDYKIKYTPKLVADQSISYYKKILNIQ